MCVCVQLTLTKTTRSTGIIASFTFGRSRSGTRSSRLLIGGYPEDQSPDPRVDFPAKQLVQHGKCFAIRLMDVYVCLCPTQCERRMRCMLRESTPVVVGKCHRSPLAFSSAVCGTTRPVRVEHELTGVQLTHSSPVMSCTILRVVNRILGSL